MRILLMECECLTKRMVWIHLSALFRGPKVGFFLENQTFLTGINRDLTDNPDLYNT